MAQEEVQITVSDAHIGKFAEVVRRLEGAGLRVEQRLAAIGVVTGRIDGEKLDGLSRITGVANIERSRTVRIPPGELGSQDTV